MPDLNAMTSQFSYTVITLRYLQCNLCSFYGEFKNEQKKDNFFLTFRSKDSNPRFLVIIPTVIWIFMEGEGNEIKSK